LSVTILAALQKKPIPDEAGVAMENFFERKGIMNVDDDSWCWMTTSRNFWMGRRLCTETI